MDNIGIFDDICLRLKVKTLDKPLAVFIQAKHRENDKLLKNDWATYFDSYMKIKQAFKPTNTDLMFKGQYDEIECFFVIYTTARGENNIETFENPYASLLNDVIGTAEGGRQTAVKNKDVEYLHKIIIKEQVTQLAKPIAKLFFDDITDYQMFMNNEHVLNYHVILAQSFCKVSDIQIGSYRLAQVRPEFFDTDDENLMTFRSLLYNELIEKRRVGDSEFKTLIALFFNNPIDVTILSKVIGCVLTNKNGKLEFVDNKIINDDLKCQLRKLHVSDVILDNAVEIAGREILTLNQNFKVPAAFGNKDLNNNNPSELNEKPHLSVYINFICYLQVELRSAPPRIMTALSVLYDKCLAYITFMNDFTTTPLNLYLTAHYFVNEIKGPRMRSENWHFEVNPFTVYVNFLSKKLKSLRLKHLDDDYTIREFSSQFKPIRKEIISYDPQRNHEIHKKLAAYAVFHENLETVFDLDELKDIKKFMKVLKYGNQKTSIIRNVVNDIPIFIHETIAEYLAVEFICDKLKREKLDLIVELILGVVDGKSSVKMMFESQLKGDSELKAIVDRNKKGVFKQILT
ncbi:hypothetical protein PYW08_012704 [Mythimna loreyi]|uniref:Uncharacterized protein n=1 Tax=Mythimna loreyi TaxID=667449 RepID=A0ACC2Q1H6_9NEOP|nr:hypothetical protein PYW08_012704 [Mythimna loreyi]